MKHPQAKLVIGNTEIGEYKSLIFLWMKLDLQWQSGTKMAPKNMKTYLSTFNEASFY